MGKFQMRKLLEIETYIFRKLFKKVILMIIINYL